MKKHATTLLLFAVMFVGLALLLYPPLADYYNSFHQSRAIASYAKNVIDHEEEDYSEYWEAARKYNEKLKKRNIVDRLIDAGKGNDGYDKLLRVGESDVLGVIEIPEIAVTLPLYHGTSEMVLQVAVGHLEGTSMPTGDPGTHVAFSAHRGLPSAKLFTNLDQLMPGDLFTIRVLDQVFTYQIDQILKVLPHQVESLEINDAMAYCSLITCTPYGINSHRLIVRGHIVPNSTAAQAARVTADAMQIDPLIVTPIVAAPMLVVLLIIMLVSTSPSKKRRKNALRKSASAMIEEIAQKSAEPQSGESGQGNDAENPNSENKNEEGGERL